MAHAARYKYQNKDSVSDSGVSTSPAKKSRTLLPNRGTEEKCSVVTGTSCVCATDFTADRVDGNESIVIFHFGTYVVSSLSKAM